MGTEPAYDVMDRAIRAWVAEMIRGNVDSDVRPADVRTVIESEIAEIVRVAFEGGAR